MSVDSTDCIVVGGGPAGLTAAYYLRRFHRTVACLDDGKSRALRIARSHNYPGFPEGISGHGLLHRLTQQLENAGGRVIAATVSQIDAVDGGFVVHHGADAIRGRTVLLATGTRDVEPAIAGIGDLRDRDLLRQCPVCDGFESSGKRIAVIGKGAHGQREADFLRTYSPHVQLVDVTARPHRIACAPSGVEIVLEDGSRVDCDVVYAALGGEPQSGLAERLGAVVDEIGNLVVDAHCRTSVTGMFAAGDVIAGLDQLAVATGHGAIAATAIHNYLREREKAE